MLYRATVLGTIWYPMVTASHQGLPYHADNDQEALESAYSGECGDFSAVRDILLERSDQCSTCGHSHWVTVRDWHDEDTAVAYLDTLPDDS